MLSKTPNSQYNLAKPHGIAIRIAGFQRRRLYQRFLNDTGIAPHERLLDVGVTADRSYSSSNYLEAWYPQKHNITAFGIDDAAFLENLFPGVRYVRGNGLQLPFRDRSFDVVHSSAVLEHVGSMRNQAQLIAKCARVARRVFFLTTPNRWFPVEFHTILPLVHWLPKPAFRKLMRAIGMAFYAEEANLNLMTSGDLERAAKTAGVAAQFEVTISKASLAAWPANLLLVGQIRT